MHWKKWMSWGMVLAWMALIFSFSAQQGSDSGSLSGSVVQMILSIGEFLFPNLALDRDLLHFLLRKGAHFMVYLILGLLSANALKTSGVVGRKRFVYALVISVLYAISDETHQAFVPERGPSIRDVFIDGAGAAVGAGIFQRFTTRCK